MKLVSTPLVLAAALLTGCTTGVYNVPPPSAPPVQSGQAASAPAESAPDAGNPAGQGAVVAPASPPVSSAAASLVVASRDQRNAGNLNGAAATVERGLTIAPDDAVLWIELAEIRLAQGDIDAAQEMARKALTLTNEGTPVAQRARQILRR